MLFLYTSAMPGAPALSETSGTMLNVLDACLVTGFNLQPLAGIEVIAGVATATVTAGHGLLRPVRCKISGHGTLNGLYPVTGTPSATTFTFDVSVPDGSYPGGSVSVAPAGWEKLYPDTDKAVYRSLDLLSTRTLWRVEQQGIYTYVAGYETMSDINTGTGQFIKSGAGSIGPKFTHGRTGSAVPRPWWIVATESMVLIYVARLYSDPAELRGCNGFFWGDPTQVFSADLHYACTLYYDHVGDVPSPHSSPFSSVLTNVAFRRSISGATGSVWGQAMTMFGAQTNNLVGTDLYIGSATDNKLVLSPITLSEGAGAGNISRMVPRGVVPYVLYSGFAMPDDSYYPAASITDGEAGSALDGKKLYSINTGQKYFGSAALANRRTFVDVTELMS